VFKSITLTNFSAAAMNILVLSLSQLIFSILFCNGIAVLTILSLRKSHLCNLLSEVDIIS